MRILLLGEYSKLHNTLKEGLVSLGHEVVLVGDGDGFKNFPVDISIKAKWFDNTPLRFLKVGIYRVFGTDLSKLERAIRCYLKLGKFKGFEVVQLINEKPIKTYPWVERWLLKRIFQNNDKVVLLSCGADYSNVSYYLNHPEEVSWLTPIIENENLQKRYAYLFDYLQKAHQKTHALIFERMNAVIASDLDYVAPLKSHPKFKGLFPNPVKIVNGPPLIEELPKKIKILLGINRGNYHAKGIPFFEEALVEIQKKYADKVSIKITENLPYAEYQKELRNTHILLDQVYSKDQGYNALEAMAMGKVVFTGADKAFTEVYNIASDKICINAKPNSSYLVEKLSMLIENPSQIAYIGKLAKEFITKHHDFEKVAGRYESLYNSL